MATLFVGTYSLSQRGAEQKVCLPDCHLNRPARPSDTLRAGQVRSPSARRGYCNDGDCDGWILFRGNACTQLPM